MTTRTYTLDDADVQTLQAAARLAAMTWSSRANRDAAARACAALERQELAHAIARRASQEGGVR